MRDATLLAANAFIGSCLYCNSLFKISFDLCKLQCVQYCLARIVTSTTKSRIIPVGKTSLVAYQALLLFLNWPYFEPFFKPRRSVYKARRSQSEGVLLEVTHFASI